MLKNQKAVRPADEFHLFSIFLTIVSLIYCWIFLRIKIPLNSEEILPTIISEFQFQSARLQLFSYIGSLLFVGLACLFFSNRKKSHIHINFNLIGMIWIFLFCSLMAFSFLMGYYTYWFFYGFFFSLLSSIVFIKIKKIPSSLVFNIAKYFLLGITITYLVIYVLIPFLTPVIMTSTPWHVAISNHYATTVLPGFDYVETGFIERSNYGIFIALLTGLGYKIITFLEPSVENPLFLIVRIYQVIAILLIIYTSRLVNIKNWVIIFSLIFLTCVSSLNTLGYSNYLPNQAGIRYISFLIGLISLIHLSKVNLSTVFFPSILASIFVVLSPETGLALTAGFLVLYLLQNLNNENVVKNIIFNLIKFFSVFIIFIIVFSNVVALFFFRNTDLNLFSFVMLFAASGFGGAVSKLSIFAALLLFFASIYVVRAFHLAGNSRSSIITNYQGTIAAVILAWLPYYMNRMHEWGLWFQAILFILLLAPNINQKFFLLLRSKSKLLCLSAITATSLIFGLIFMSSERVYQETTDHYLKYQSPGCSFSLSLSQKTCYFDKEPIDYSKYFSDVLNISNKDDHLFLSHFSSEIRLFGLNKGFPWYDSIEITTKQELSKIVNWIEKNRPRYIHIDNPQSELSKYLSNRIVHVQNIVSQLSSYELKSRNEYWNIYSLKNLEN